MFYKVHLAWARFELTTFVMIGTDCIGSYKSNYDHDHDGPLSIIASNKTRRVPHVEQELLNHLDHLSSYSVFGGVRVLRSLVFCVMFCRMVTYYWPVLRLPDHCIFSKLIHKPTLTSLLVHPRLTLKQKQNKINKNQQLYTFLLCNIRVKPYRYSSYVTVNSLLFVVYQF
jgi:hypothetical protein